jgi:hypothetical protein
MTFKEFVDALAKELHAEYSDEEIADITRRRVTRLASPPSRGLP